MLRGLLIFVGLFHLLAHAQDPEAVQAPYIEVGDCWTFKVKGLFRGGWIESFRGCVAHIDRQKNIVIEVSTVQPGGAEYEITHTLTWGAITTLKRAVLRPSQEFLRFPLHVGDTYPVEYEYLAETQGYVAIGTSRGTAKVIGWEDVSVPAGNYRALKIEIDSVWRSNVRAAGSSRHVVWYAPSARRVVKSIYAADGDTPGESELSSLQLNP